MNKNLLVEIEKWKREIVIECERHVMLESRWMLDLSDLWLMLQSPEGEEFRRPMDFQKLSQRAFSYIWSEMNLNRIDGIHF